MHNILLIVRKKVLRNKLLNLYCCDKGALEHTTSWIKSAVEELSTTIPKEQPNGPGKGQRLVPGPFQILNTAFFCILTWDYDKGPLPEVRVF